MGLFEKIEMELPEPEETGVEIPKSSRQWTDETFTVVLQPERKASATAAICGCLMIFVFIVIVDSGNIMFEVCTLVTLVFLLIPCRLFMTNKVIFTPESILQNMYFGQNVLPVNSLEILVNEQSVGFFHGTKKNINESVSVLRKFVTEEEFADIIKYAEDVYHVKPNVRESTSLAGTSAAHAAGIAVVEFTKTVDAYKMTAVFMVVFSLVVIFSAGIFERFIGFAPTLSAYPARLGCICLAIAGYILLKRLNVPDTGGGARPDPLTQHLKSLHNTALLQGLVAVVVVALGFVLFLLLGNRLDFYFFLVAGILFHIDFFPCYSAWEQALKRDDSKQSVPIEQRGLPKRSLHVSLVLMGTLSVISYGESNHYMYKNRQDCLDDWAADEKNCQEVSDNHNRYRVRGPRYGTPGKPTRSVGMGTISRGGFGSSGSFHASFGG